MNLADLLAVAIAAGAFIGGCAGLVMPFRDARDLLDNGQRGAFGGALVGSLGAFVIAFGINASGA